jgi:hypothetical protein
LLSGGSALHHSLVLNKYKQNNLETSEHTAFACGLASGFRHKGGMPLPIITPSQ